MKRVLTAAVLIPLVLLAVFRAPCVWHWRHQRYPLLRSFTSWSLFIYWLICDRIVAKRSLLSLSCFPSGQATLRPTMLDAPLEGTNSLLLLVLIRAGKVLLPA